MQFARLVELFNKKKIIKESRTVEQIHADYEQAVLQEKDRHKIALQALYQALIVDLLVYEQWKEIEDNEQ